MLLSLAERRLYYNDSYLWEFDAVVQVSEPVGDALHIMLDRSAFYPTSGGQPHDTGYLGPVRVTDVFVRGEDVVHVVDGPLAVGESVHARIDGQRRFDFMQQHCGQHILSRAFEVAMNVETVGFHLGAEWVTIDLAVSALSWGDIRNVEELANQVIWENRPVTAQFVEAADLGRFHLRHAPKVDKDIRIVSIVGFDDNACGGTHPRFTGEVGQIKVVRTEPMRGGVRLTFLCGTRALADYQRKVDLLREMGQALSTGPDELLANLQKLQSTLATAQKQLNAAHDQLAQVKAAAFLDAAEVSADGRRRVFATIPDGNDLGDLKRVAEHLRRLTGDTPCTAALVGESGTSGRIFVQVLSTAPELAANDWFRTALTPLGAKGGGNAQSAQGSLEVREHVTSSTVLSALQKALA